MWLIHQFGSLLDLGICKEYPHMAKAKSPRNGASLSKPVASTPAGAATAPALAPEAAGNRPTDLVDEIRQRAYELFQQRGCTPGHEDEDWLVAEREIRARHNVQKSA
jgi:hypothetical protein